MPSDQSDSRTVHQKILDERPAQHTCRPGHSNNLISYIFFHSASPFSPRLKSVVLREGEIRDDIGAFLFQLGLEKPERAFHLDICRGFQSRRA